MISSRVELRIDLVSRKDIMCGVSLSDVFDSLSI
ncbi:MAG: hypothetical protein MjAS7_2104 [Metallosphaera javensis (ex Sakai et al. 2022)]|nr:MAG: hypothetical protein MjAS7_2104 [Metallosphaera javensis (ex Sakai et al. 2022)]